MSKLNRKELKASLKEWKSFLLNEHKIISRDELIRSLQRNNITGKEIDFFIEFWDSNRFITKYTQVIQNELNTTQEPIEEILDVCKLHYEKIYQSAGPKLKDQIGSGSTSIDELRKQIDAKVSFNKNEVRQQCRYRNGRPIVGNYDDFDVVYSEEDHIVIEPKTIQGSIAWTHGKPDGSEETDQKRRSGWCTGVSTGNNMFPNYAGNLHMFYIVNTDYDNDKSANRRLCLSFRIQNGVPVLTDSSASVDASNRPLGYEGITSIQNQRYYPKILERLKGRNETSFTEVYSKCTLNQFLRLREQMISQKIDKSLMEKEISLYGEHAKDLDLVVYLVKNSDLLGEVVAHKIAEREDFFQIDENSELINLLIKKKNVRVNETLLVNAKRQENISQEHLKIIDMLKKEYKTNSFLYFQKPNFKRKDLDKFVENISRSGSTFEIFDEKEIKKIINFIIKKAKEGFKITRVNFKNMLQQLSKRGILSNERIQMSFAKLVAKSDYDSQRLFLEDKHTTKKAYMYIAKKTLPLKGMGVGLVYQYLHHNQKTYEMLQDPEIAEMFVNYASKGLLRNVFDKIAILVNLKNNIENLDDKNEAAIYYMTISDYDVGKLSLEESIDLVIKAGPVLYRAVQNSPNAMSIKKNRFEFEKALRQQNLIESNVKSLRDFIKLVLS